MTHYAFFASLGNNFIFNLSVNGDIVKIRDKIFDTKIFLGVLDYFINYENKILSRSE